jgi:nitroreductase
MELKEAIGTRRSYRFLRPYQAVERSKIQKMLEASRLASHWGNVGALRAVVIEKSSATEEAKEVIQGAILGFQLEIAPVVIVWYLEYATLDVQGDRLHELLEVRAQGVDKEASKKILDEFMIPFFQQAMPGIKAGGLTDMDCGQGIAQATLIAIEEGLGTCLLGTPRGEEIKQKLGLPDTAKVLVLQCVGYPAESKAAGGQRPRQPFEQMFHLNSTANPFPRDEAVVEELERDKMIQAPAPLPGRDEELVWLKKALDLPPEV